MPLALRLIESGMRRRRRAEALSGWFQLCWQAPERVPEALEALRFPELHGLWQRFAEEEAADAQPLAAAREHPALTAADFPAWLLLDEPSLARLMPAELPIGASTGEQHYRLVHRWIGAREAQRLGDEIALRKALKERQPALLEKLLRGVEKDRGRL